MKVLEVVLPHDRYPEAVGGREEPATTRHLLVGDGGAFKLELDIECLSIGNDRAAGGKDILGFMGGKGVDGKAILKHRSVRSMPKAGGEAAPSGPPSTPPATPPSY